MNVGGKYSECYLFYRTFFYFGVLYFESFVPGSRVSGHDFDYKLYTF